MGSNLSDILEEESSSFQRLDNVWRPKNLFQEIQTKELLRGMSNRYQSLQNSSEELKVLDRGDWFLKQLRKLGFILKRSNFVRQANHLAFGQAVAEFYSIYGEVLRYLKIDQARGKLA